MSTTRNGPIDGIEPGDGAGERQARLLRARQQLGLDAHDGGDGGEELVPIGGVARRRRGHDPQRRVAVGRRGRPRSRRSVARVRSMASAARRRRSRRRPGTEARDGGAAFQVAVAVDVPGGAPSSCRCRWRRRISAQVLRPPSARPDRRRRRGTRRSGRGGTSRRCAVPPTPPCGRGPVPARAGWRRRARRRSGRWAVGERLRDRSRPRRARTPPAASRRLTARTSTRPTSQYARGHRRAVVEQRRVADDDRAHRRRRAPRRRRRRSGGRPRRAVTAARVVGHFRRMAAEQPERR